MSRVEGQKASRWTLALLMLVRVLSLLSVLILLRPAALAVVLVLDRLDQPNRPPVVVVTAVPPLALPLMEPEPDCLLSHEGKNEETRCMAPST
jgi:hypothetical protein